MLPQPARSHRPLFWIALLCTVLAWEGAARADQVDKMISQMGSATYKVRLSAALNLTKLGDRRAIPAFIRALNDSDKTVRGVAAAGLGKLVGAATTADLRTKALAALKSSASKDSNAFVRKQAQKAYDALKMIKGGGGSGPALASGSIFVNIGGMSATTANSGTIKSVMKAQAEKTFRAKAAKMVLAGSSGPPSAATIKSKGVHAFHVEGTVNEIKVRGSLVECKVSLLLATYPEKSMFGFLKGGAAVEDSDTERATEDCVAAVIDDMIAKKIIPTILARAGG
ncbi:MAG TPA: HEAT repeat domain-containing protein [Kofleriaceae bacterium]|nr:HEAT repeat domain-containing protein [Kofleriaceae bacterium]